MKKLMKHRRIRFTMILLALATVALAATIVGTNGTFTTSIDAKGFYHTTYTPKTSGAKCSSIYMVQTLKITDQSNNPINPKKLGLGHMSDDMTSDDTMVDHLSCEKDKYYNGKDADKDTESEGSNDGTTATATTMEDKPNVPDEWFPSGVSTITMSFEVCAVCKTDGKVLDCYTWTWTRTKGPGNVSTSTPGTTASKPSSEYTAAVKKFNTTHKNDTHCPDKAAETNAGTSNATSSSGKTTPETPIQNTPFLLEWDVINTSGMDMFDVEYEVLVDGMPLTSGMVPFIPYFDFETVYIDMPPLSVGPHSVIVTIDPANVIPEYDEDDNIALEDFEIADVSPAPEDAPETGIYMQMLQPNPTHGDFNVMLRLGTDTTARLTIIDVRGRVVQSRTLQGAAGDLRTERFHLEANLGAGVYFVRLEQGNLSETRKFIMLR